MKIGLLKRTTRQLSDLVIPTGFAIGIFYVFLRGFSVIPPLQCPWRFLANIPCPFCGTTTAISHLISFDFIAAFRTNPIISVLALVGAAVSLNNLFGFVFRKQLTIDFPRREKWIFFGVFVLAIAANWIYMLFFRKL